MYAFTQHRPATVRQAASLLTKQEEAKLLAETGDHPANPTMSLAARTVLGSGQKPIEVVGPFPEIEDEFLAPHHTFWRLEEPPKDLSFTARPAVA